MWKVVTPMTASPLSDTALLQLMTWLSPSYPVGGYVYSHGIEFAVEDGRVTDEAALVRWIRGIVTFGAGRVDGVLFAKAWQAVTDKDEKVLFETIECADAMRGTSELILEGTAQGEAFVDTVRQTTSSARPAASLAIRSAVAGAMIISSHHRAKATCGDSWSWGGSKASVSTRDPVRLSKVAGPTKRQATGVMSTRTEAPACTARLTRVAVL